MVGGLSDLGPLPDVAALLGSPGFALGPFCQRRSYWRELQRSSSMAATVLIGVLDHQRRHSRAAASAVDNWDAGRRAGSAHRGGRVVVEPRSHRLLPIVEAAVFAAFNVRGGDGRGCAT